MAMNVLLPYEVMESYLPEQLYYDPDTDKYFGKDTGREYVYNGRSTLWERADAAISKMPTSVRCKTACECGAATMGVKPRHVGHSHWCPVSPAP